MTGIGGVDVRVETMLTISALIRGRRRDLSLSQTRLAAKAGVSRKFISDVESGKDTVEIGKLLGLLGALELLVDVTTANGSPVPETQNPPDLDVLMAAYLADDR